MALFDCYISDVENRRIFICYLTFTLAAASSYFIAFVSPSWIAASSEFNALFNRIGLWTACFDGYMRPTRYDKAYYGCFYIYSVEYDLIRDWLNPVWLYIIQFAASLGTVCEVLVVFLVLCQATGRLLIESLKLIKLLMTGHFMAGMSILCALLGFTYGSFDNRWVPYPRFNRLSWGYFTASLSLFLILISFFTMLVFYLKVQGKIRKSHLKEYLDDGGNNDEVYDDDDKNVEDEIRKLASASASRIYSHPGCYIPPFSSNFADTLGSVVENLDDNNDDVITLT